MQIQEIFEDLLNVYDNSWFGISKAKFINHPLNKEPISESTPTVFDTTNAKSQVSNRITLYDFLKGKRDESFDDVFLEDQMSKNLEITEVDLEGNEIYSEKPGYTYIPLSSLYPSPNISEWKIKVINEIKDCLTLTTSLKEKETFFDYINSIAKEKKTEITHKYVTEHLECINSVLDEIILFISKISNRITMVQNILDEHEHRIKLSISQAQLSKLIFLLFEKNYFTPDTSSIEITTFFEKNALIMKDGKSKRPISLSTAYRRLTSKNESKRNTEWAKQIDLNL